MSDVRGGLYVPQAGRFPQAGLLAILRQRWSDITVMNPVDIDPSWSMTIDMAVRLAALRRGIEPLRAIVMPQADRRAQREMGSSFVAPMPILF